ncbi:nitroreductase family protein [Roseococcus pinisoli]|uniref:Putative NAD(P)H nitroreductase n=1 Tax=Roseococcus pinisoli TaxID=2835040 RepID=A0ABS5Q7G0_9PROT|nr:nitroreductase [Roseococcus pinisoli]MBS7809398.1 nitroreductase [Roseococcus pinisoli]
MPDHLAPPPSALDALLGRASVPPRLLRAPVPDRAALDLAVSAALRAPDHGGLRPWRFVFIEGEARRALGDLLAASLLARAPDTPAERLEIERGKPLRAPLVVAAGAAINHDRPGVPPWEQEASAAAGIMNFLHALDATGFGGCWLSSPSLKDPAVLTALGFAAGDSLLGWIYVGTPEGDRPRPIRPAPEAFSRYWTPGS